MPLLVEVSFPMPLLAEILMPLVLEVDNISYNSYWTRDIYLACIMSLLFLFTHTHARCIFHDDVYLYVDGDVYVRPGKICFLGVLDTCAC